jgi:hypothetical protein
VLLEFTRLAIVFNKLSSAFKFFTPHKRLKCTSVTFLMVPGFPDTKIELWEKAGRARQGDGTPAK